MARCGCASSTCQCSIEAGANVTVTGTGSALDPFVVSSTGGGAGAPNVNVADTATVDMTRTGTGTVPDPYIVSGAAKIDPVGGNLVTGASGLLVSTESVQDAVGGILGNGLVYDDAGNAIRARLSTDGLNGASFGTDGGLYVGGNARVGQQRAMGAVAFSWDDGWSTHPAIANAHALRGQKATFYVTSNLLGTAQHMAAAAMAPMVAQGHEIGCHSADHTDMTTLTPTTRIPQWASAATLEGIIGGGYKIRSYAYPLGNNNLATNSEAYGRFDRVAAIGLSQGYYTGASGYAPWLYEAGAEYEGFRHGRFPWSQTTHAQFMQLLDMVRRRPVVLTAYAHQIGNADTPTQAQVDEAMDFCLANGIPCITAKEAIPGPKIVNPGFESGLDGWTTILAGAATAGTTVDTIVDTPDAGLSGTKSLRIISPNTQTPSDSVHVFQTVPVQPMRAYTVSGRLRQDAAGSIAVGPTGSAGFSVRINEFNGVGGSIASRNVKSATSGIPWTQVSCTSKADAVWPPATFHTLPDTRFVTVGIHLQEYYGTTYYADHIAIFPTEEGIIG